MILPKGMFTLVNGNTLIYNGGIETIVKDWVSRIRAKALAVTEENVTDFVGKRYILEKELSNPLGTSCRFYLDNEGTQSFSEQSDELVRMIKSLNHGDCLYIGGIIDYHR